MAGGGSSELQAMKQVVMEMGLRLRALDGRLVEQAKALQDLARQLAQVQKVLARGPEGAGTTDASQRPVQAAAGKTPVASRSRRSTARAAQGRTPAGA